MIIKELPKEIYDLIKQRTLEQGNQFDDSKEVFWSPVGQRKGLNWARTPEGNSFWYNIQDGKFDEFYKKYPKEGPKINNTIINKDITVYKVKNGLDNYEVTIKKL